MIVDLHRHLWSVAERYPGVRIPGAVGGSLHAGAESAPEPIPDLERRGAEIVAEMDAAGVDRSVVFLGDYGLRLGEGTFTVEAENRLTAELARRHADRLIAFNIRSFPRSIRRARFTSPSRVNSGTAPISRRYTRTGSSV